MVLKLVLHTEQALSDLGIRVIFPGAYLLNAFERLPPTPTPFVLKRLPLRISGRVFVQRAPHRGCGVAPVPGCASWYYPKAGESRECPGHLLPLPRCPRAPGTVVSVLSGQCGCLRSHCPERPLCSPSALRHGATAQILALPFLTPILLEPIPQPP